MSSIVLEPINRVKFYAILNAHSETKLSHITPEGDITPVNDDEKLLVSEWIRIVPVRSIRTLLLLPVDKLELSPLVQRNLAVKAYIIRQFAKEYNIADLFTLFTRSAINPFEYDLNDLKDNTLSYIFNTKTRTVLITRHGRMKEMFYRVPRNICSACEKYSDQGINLKGCCTNCTKSQLVLTGSKVGLSVQEVGDSDYDVLSEKLLLEDSEAIETYRKTLQTCGYKNCYWDQRCYSCSLQGKLLLTQGPYKGKSTIHILLRSPDYEGVGEIDKKLLHSTALYFAKHKLLRGTTSTVKKDDKLLVLNNLVVMKDEVLLESIRSSTEQTKSEQQLLRWIDSEVYIKSIKHSATVPRK